MRYFSKAVPQSPVVLSNGAGVRFENIDHNVGIFATDNEALIREIDACIAAGRGGVESITAEDFLALKAKKKEQPLKPRWREEYSMAQRGRIRSGPRQPGAAHAESVSPPPAPTIQTPEEAITFRPTATQ